MRNYPLTPLNKAGTLLKPHSSSYSDEYATRMCNLHLRDELHKDKKGIPWRYYRLYAREPHSIEMALIYDIKCPKCSCGTLKKVTRCNNYNDLGLYECPICNKR